jgi:flavorubredoxin
MISTARVAPDTHTLSATWSGPGGVVVPTNAYCMLGTEPALIDTGMSTLTEEFRGALWNIVDPADLRWIIVTHDDRDHTGSLMAILDEAPNATLVTNFISMVKMSEDFELPFDRLRLINSGERLEVGDDVFETFRPPNYDSPGTLAFHALRRNVCFSSDCMGGFLPAMAEAAEDLPAAEYHAGVAMFTSAISPWLHDTTPGHWQAGLDALRQRKPDVLLSTHGLPISSGLPALLDATAALPTGPAFVPPGQEFVESMLAMAGPH